MTRSIIALAGTVTAVLLTAIPSTAQMEEGPRSTSTGLSVGLFGSSAFLTMVEDRTTTSGGGAGLSLGYGFTPAFAVHLSTSGAVLRPSSGESQLLGHVDLEARFTFADQSRAWAPHLAAGVGARTARQGPPVQGDGPTEWRGNPGLTVGGGLSYFLTPAVSMDLALRYSFGNLKQMSCPAGGETANSCATSTRVNVGATWYRR